jgi:hypothetical protein
MKTKAIEPALFDTAPSTIPMMYNSIKS